MEKADLPSETAQEPVEEAHQPLSGSTMSPSSNAPNPKRFGITFAEDTQSTEITTSSQCNSSYKDVLSQPGPSISHKQRLLWLQKRRDTGLWVQCDACDKWRFLPHILDQHELPDKWFCKMNTDRTASECSVPEAPIRLREEEDLIHSEYSSGSVVWARMAGWPWWPAMVDDCPDTEQFYWLDGFSDIPTHYNVVFFDGSEVTRAWIAPNNLKPYGPHKKNLKHVAKSKKYRKRLEVAFKQADDADMLPLTNRLAKYSFVARYKGNIGSPKKISKPELNKFKNKLKRRLDIEFSDESENDSDESSLHSEKAAASHKKRQETRNKNVILVGTPKKVKRQRKNSRRLEADGATVDVIDGDTTDKVVDNSKGKETLKPVANVEGVFKQPDSMTVQIDSTSINDTSALDNDSSKTYVPENQIANTRDDSQMDTDKEFQVRIASPSSDDFEF